MKYSIVTADGDWCVEGEEVRAPLHCVAGAKRQWDHLIYFLARCPLMYYLLLSHIHHPYFYSIYYENGTESFVLFPTSNISLSDTSNVTTPRLENIISIFSLTAQSRWTHSYNWIGFILSSYWHLVTLQVLSLSVELLLQCRAPTVPDPLLTLVSVCQEPTSTASCSWWRAAWSPPSWSSTTTTARQTPTRCPAGWVLALVALCTLSLSNYNKCPITFCQDFGPNDFSPELTMGPKPI